MKIDVHGDALALLEDFINGATGLYYINVANALYYVEDAFLHRAILLNKALQKAKRENEKQSQLQRNGGSKNDTD